VSPTMRDQFTAATERLMAEWDDVALVLADIGVDRFDDVAARYPGRVVNVGIREQALIGVAAGLSLAGRRPIVHTYAPFLLERPFEQVKLDLGHQGLGAVLVSVGASYDWAEGGRTHHAPGDVALLDTLPGWTVHVPGHPDEVPDLLTRAVTDRGCHYLRLTESQHEHSARSVDGQLVVVRRSHAHGPTIVAVGPMLGPTLAAIADHDATVLYATTVRPFDATTLRGLASGADLIVIEPYLAGTSARVVAEALADRPIRYRNLGVAHVELRRYGNAADHDAAHGLDASGLRSAIADVLTG
jgi:transketolase